MAINYTKVTWINGATPVSKPSKRLARLRRRQPAAMAAMAGF